MIRESEDLERITLDVGFVAPFVAGVDHHLSSYEQGVHIFAHTFYDTAPIRSQDDSVGKGPLLFLDHP